MIVLVIGFLCWENRGSRLLKQEIRELQQRLAESEERIDVRYIHDTVPVYQTKVVEVDRTDYKRILADRETIRELGLRVAQLESENRTLMSTRDTVVLHEEGDSLYTYKDRWVSFRYLTSRRVLDYAVRDSLSTFVSREYRHRFLWWRWGTKGYNVSIVSHNPNTKIEYNKYIKIR